MCVGEGGVLRRGRGVLRRGRGVLRRGRGVFTLKLTSVCTSVARCNTFLSRHQKKKKIILRSILITRTRCFPIVPPPLNNCSPGDRGQVSASTACRGHCALLTMHVLVVHWLRLKEVHGASYRPRRPGHRPQCRYRLPKTGKPSHTPPSHSPPKFYFDTRARYPMHVHQSPPRLPSPAPFIAREDSF